jgi:hypothetical protein
MADLLIGYGYPIRGGDREEQFSCDLHGDGRDRKPSGRFYPDSNTIYCFTCGKVRDTIELIREKEGLDFWSAVKILEERYRLPPLPWEADDTSRKPDTAVQIERALDPQRTFTDDLKRLTRLLKGATGDRQIPLPDLLAFWEARDKLAWIFDEGKATEKQARLAADALRERLLKLLTRESA